MKRSHIIGLDVHCKETQMAVLTEKGRLTNSTRVATTIPALLGAITAVRGSRVVVLEEGPLADWLYRNLRRHADEVVVCDPRRNHLIAKDGDKDDPIDAEKLARLYLGGYVKKIHHADAFDRAVFKQQVGLYHDRVRNRVRQANRIMGQLRRHGVFVQERGFADPAKRENVLSRLPGNPIVRAQLECLCEGYDAAVQQEKSMEQMLIRAARKEPQIRRFTALPGVGWIRAATFFAYVDTPWRFKSKSSLWRYLGIGLERRQSGEGRVQVHVVRSANWNLKSMILGAALSAIASRRNVFADQYGRWLDGGCRSRNARRNVARSLAGVMWGMWKTGSVYRPEWVGVSAAELTAASSVSNR